MGDVREGWGSAHPLREQVLLLCADSNHVLRDSRQLREQATTLRRWLRDYAASLCRRIEPPENSPDSN